MSFPMRDRLMIDILRTELKEPLSVRHTLGDHYVGNDLDMLCSVQTQALSGRRRDGWCL